MVWPRARCRPRSPTRWTTWSRCRQPHGPAAGGLRVEADAGFGPRVDAAARILHDGGTHAGSHGGLLGNYGRWLRHTRLPSSLSLGSVGGERGSLGSVRIEGAALDWHDDSLSARIHRLLLWLLIWGEAANCRHAPECLCFLFYCATHALEQPAPRKGSAADITGARRLPLGGPVPVAGEGMGSMPHEEGDFGDTIIAPLYEFLRESLRSAAVVGERVMYDDFNEAFWRLPRCAPPTGGAARRVRPPPRPPRRKPVAMRAEGGGQDVAADG